MSEPRARRLALLGALSGVGLGLLHAAGWGAYFATLPTPRDYPSAAAFAWRVAKMMAVVGVPAGAVIGALVGTVTATLPELPAYLLTAVAAGWAGLLTAAKRLVPRLRSSYGRWLDTLLVDALYANGPFLTVADQSKFGVIVVLKKATDEPLKEALALWDGEPPERVVEVVNDSHNERIELWDCTPLETLSSYKGSIRVVRAVVHHDSGDKRTWCFGITGKAARRLSAQDVVAAGRGRWHIENTAFNQWTQYWHFCHVFVHDGGALFALLWVFVLALNLMQLFVYRQLRGYGRDANDVTRTIISLVDEMKDDCARLTEPIAWDCWDTS